MLEQNGKVKINIHPTFSAKLLTIYHIRLLSYKCKHSSADGLQAALSTERVELWISKLSRFYVLSIVFFVQNDKMETFSVVCLFMLICLQ